jgi:replicative DNA helicase Mcm
VAKHVRLHAPSRVPAPPQLVAAWDTALAAPYVRPLLGTSVATLPWGYLDRANPELGQALLEQPAATFRAAQEHLAARVPPAPGRLRVIGLPGATPIRALRPEHLGRLVAVEGLVKRASAVKPSIVEALWKCFACLCELEHTVPFGDLEEPLQCYEDKGGCSKTAGFTLLEEKSVKVPAQRLEIQENPESLVGGEPPGRLTLRLTDDLCGLVMPGDRVVVNGILRDTRKAKGRGKWERDSEYWLDVVSVEPRQQAYEAVTITPEEEAAFRALAASPDAFHVLVSSIAPSLHGLEEEKLAVLLQLVGGSELAYGDGRRSRGEIHVLLVGDPGVAKSELLRVASRISPRGIFASGKGSSAAGLTAAVVKDDDDRWSFEAGALVLADRGLACLDELEKMSEDDRRSIHGALEQGVVSLAKAGLTVELNSRCAVLAAANPKDGRFDPHFSALAEQIDLDPPLLSRFDLIFLLRDQPAEAHDRATIRAVLGLTSTKPPLEPASLRKFAALARRQPSPSLTPEAAQRIEDHYVGARKARKAEDPIPLTPRHGTAVHRLAQASARVRLSADVEVEDVERALALVEVSLRRTSPDGIFDVDVIAAGVGHKKRDRLHRILVEIAKLEAGNESGANEADLLAALNKLGMPAEDALPLLEQLRERGEVLRNTRGGVSWYRRVPR